MKITHDEFIFKGSYNRKGDRLLTCSQDKSAIVWDAQTGRALLRFENKSHWGIPHTGFSPDGLQVITADGHDNTARVWDANSGALISVLKGHGNSSAMPPSGLMGRLPSRQATIKALSCGTRSRARRCFVMDHAEELEKAMISPDGARLQVMGTPLASSFITIHRWSSSCMTSPSQRQR